MELNVCWQNKTGEESTGTAENKVWLDNAGPIVSNIDTSSKKRTCLVSSQLEERIERFWTIEEIEEKKHYTDEEIICEKHFRQTTKRNEDGRYVVSLPQKENVNLGESFQIALRRFYALERKLEKDSSLKKQYIKFMDEYKRLKHMSLVVAGLSNDVQTCYLPHHPVVRQESLTTKLRVVFDASCKTTSGHSLNSKLLVGATIQNDLLNIILRFRMHEIVLTADIAMMYRQILVSDEDKNLQRIIWRAHSSEELQIYTLDTVTYGTASAPFLATRVLKQLAEDDGNYFPVARRAMLEDFYMDDVITGCKTVEEAKDLRKQLSDLLAKGKLNLRKWRSNNKEVLGDITKVDQEDSLLVLNKHETLKTNSLELI